jgi:hypothetical protein
MRKLVAGVSALALALLVAGPALSRQAKAAACPMTTKAPAKYCEKCAMVIDAKDIKDGKCGKDQSALIAVQICVKEHYICGCGKSCCTDDKEKPGNCKCAKPLKKETNNSLITYTCSDCKASSPVKDKVMHTADCKKKDAKMACSH